MFYLAHRLTRAYIIYRHKYSIRDTSIGTILLDAPPTQRYTPLMRRQRLSMLLLLLLAAALASCSHQHEQPSLYRRFSLWRVRKRRAFQRFAHFSGVQYSLVPLLLPFLKTPREWGFANYFRRLGHWYAINR